MTHYFQQGSIRCLIVLFCLIWALFYIFLTMFYLLSIVIFTSSAGGVINTMSVPYCCTACISSFPLICFPGFFLYRQYPLNFHLQASGASVDLPLSPGPSARLDHTFWQVRLIFYTLSLFHPLYISVYDKIAVQAFCNGVVTWM